MMKKTSLLLAGFAAFLLACGNSSDETFDSGAAIENFNQETTLTPIDLTESSNPTEGTESSSIAINPPHGEPGHDCAIPVGAPLNQSAGDQSVMQPAIAPTGQKINPPHGEPGHDCAIPVGAPLN